MTQQYPTTQKGAKSSNDTIAIRTADGDRSAAGLISLMKVCGDVLPLVSKS